MKGIMKRRKVPKYKENPFIKDVAEHTQIGYKKIASKDNSALVVMNKEQWRITRSCCRNMV